MLLINVVCNLHILPHRIVVCFTVVRLKRRYKCHKSVFLSGRIKQQMFDSLCGRATSFVNSDLPINININGNANQNEHQSKPDEPVIRSAPPSSSHHPPRCGCTKERSAKNMLRAATQQKTKADNRRQQQKRKKEKKTNSVAFPAAVNMANVRGSGLCKTQHGKRITDSMECSYFCHSFVLLCHLGKKSE